MQETDAPADRPTDDRPARSGGGPSGPAGAEPPEGEQMRVRRAKRERLLAKMRLGMLVHGIDLKSWRGGIVSAAHTEADVEWTLDAWRKTLRALKAEGDLPA